MILDYSHLEGFLTCSEPGRIPIPDFVASLRRGDAYTGGESGKPWAEARKAYIDANIPRLHRIATAVSSCYAGLAGPCLDVASGWGILWPVLQDFFPKLLPYEVAELTGNPLDYDGTRIPNHNFQCENSRLGVADGSFGSILFFDCLEHLIVDPLWTLLEFNRVLRTGGHVVLSTPNAAAAFRGIRVFSGLSPATENEMKPAAIYQRHNREYTPLEVAKLLECAGFQLVTLDTQSHLCSAADLNFIAFAGQQGVPVPHAAFFGPEIFAVARKVEHRTLDSSLPEDLRWPAWLYTGYPAYRRRPDLFPIVVGPDYA